MSVDDPYGTETLRTNVLDAWSAAPSRFREDANAEEDQALGGYRDRLVVELAQNAADAAARAGIPGRLRLVLDGGELRAANTGAPLDPAGVESLSTLRASAKRDDPTGDTAVGTAAGTAAGTAVGRFGVGFAAVLAVSDEPRVLSRDGGVAWSRERAADAVRAIPPLADELRRREGHVPVLRLPFPYAGTPAEGYDTEVVLPLRDDDARAVAHRLLGETGPALLLGLPALRHVEIEVTGAVRELRAGWNDDGTASTDDGGSVTRWRLSTATGRLDASLLADRPVEERQRPAWSVTWALPVGRDGLPGPRPTGVTPVLYAPTPSDEPVDLPALLLASFPLDPGRRHVAPGPLADHLVERAARAYADLLPGLPPDPDVLDLVPGPVAAGALDAALREGIHRALRGCPFLPSVGGARLRPPDAVAADVPSGLIDVLTDVLPALVPAGWAQRRSPLSWLGVRRLELADVVDLLATLERPPDWWRRAYDELGGTDLDALGALPVPLADGRTVRGPRGVLLPVAGLDVAALAELGVRLADPRAAHPLLLRLGAVEGTPRAVLADARVVAAVESSYDADDPDAIAAAVLPVVRDAGLDPGEEPWLAALALRDAEGDARPADELLLPGSPLASVVAPDAPFGVVAADLVERWGEGPLEAAGVLASFALVREEDVPLDAGCDHDLDAEDDWVAATRRLAGAADMPPVIAELVAVRDLDLVDPDRWDDALALLLRPPLRAALTEPAAVLLPDGRRLLAPSYTSWWLRTHPVLGGRRAADLRMPGAGEVLAGLYDEAPAADPALLAALGVRRDLAGLLAERDGATELLDRLADPERRVSAGQLGALYAALALADPAAVEPPQWLRVPYGATTGVVPARDVVVVDAPDLLPLLGDRPCLAVSHDRAESLAALLDLPLAGEVVAGRVESAGDPEPVPVSVAAVLPGAPDTYLAHDPLVVDGHTVDWRYDDGAVHAASLAGLARGLAWAGGRWELRHLLAALLDEPDAAAVLLAEAAFDGTPD